MNKKGFAISVILYVIVFLIIAIFYLLLGIIKARYNVSNELKNSIVTTLNGTDHIYSKLTEDSPVNVLIINPNGGKIIINGEEITDSLEIIKYGDEEFEIPLPSREQSHLGVDTYTLSYDSSGGFPTPSGSEINLSGTITYNFRGWVPSSDCGTLNGNTYTFPSTYATTCTITADWDTSSPTYTDSSVILATGVEKTGYDFVGWKSSINGTVYNAGVSYTLEENTVMTAQWELNAFARQLEYSNSNLSCGNIQCALDKLDSLLK